MAKRMIRVENPTITEGVMGKHTGDVASVKFFDRIGLDNLTCHPMSIPGAKLAAAQANIQRLWCSKVAREDQFRHIPCDVTGNLTD